MRFVRVCCGRCGLAFQVVLRDGDRLVQVDRGRWARTCPLTATCPEPRMCGDLRRAAQDTDHPDPA